MDGARDSATVRPHWHTAAVGRKALYDSAALGSLLDLQYGLVTRQQAVSCGLTDAAVHHRLRGSRVWQMLLPGVYLTTTGSPTGPQRIAAAQLYAGPEGVITGAAALAAHGIGRFESAIVDVLIPWRCKRQDYGFARVRRTSRMPEETHQIGPARYAPAGRAVIDAARWLTDLGDVRALICGAVQRGRVCVADLAGELAAGPVVRSALIREVLTEAAEGVRSAAEADLRVLIKRGGLPDPMYNPRLCLDGVVIAVPDAWWPDAGVAAEVDSRQWHLSPRDWERTLARHSRMSACGIIVLHYPPRRLRDDSTAVAAEIRSALAASRGRALPKLQTQPSLETPVRGRLSTLQAKPAGSAPLRFPA